MYSYYHPHQMTNSTMFNLHLPFADINSSHFVSQLGQVRPKLPICSALSPTVAGCSSELPRPSPPSSSLRRMDDAAAWDLNVISEEDFDQLAVYQVQDKSSEEIEAVVKSSPSLSRAEASLPRNLILKPSQEKHTDVSIFLCFYVNLFN